MLEPEISNAGSEESHDTQFVEKNASVIPNIEELSVRGPKYGRY